MRTIILALIAVSLQAQATAPQLYTWAILPGDKTWTNAYVAIDPSLELARVSGGKFVIRAKPAPGIIAGPGITVSTVPATSQVQVSVDTAFVTRRFPTVPVPGKCDVLAGVWSADIGHFYFCVPNADRSEFVWARVPVEINWDSVPRCVQGAFGNVTCSEFPAPPIDVVYVQETDEVAVPTTNTVNGGWLLAYVPEFDLSCTRNGIPQTSGVEYSPSGNQLISGIWQAADVIKCSYRRRQLP